MSFFPSHETEMNEGREGWGKNVRMMMMMMMKNKIDTGKNYIHSLKEKRNGSENDLLPAEIMLVCETFKVH